MNFFKLVFIAILLTFSLEAKKSAYSGFGKISRITGLPKTKIVSGHVKRTKRGCVYVNPNARSR
jgi:hypothetical protein